MCYTIPMSNHARSHNNLVTAEKAKALLSVKKAAGTIAKVQQMVENDAYCIDIIQQIDAVAGLLQSAKKTLLSGHLAHCLADKLKEDKGKTIEELIKVYNAAR